MRSRPNVRAVTIAVVVGAVLAIGAAQPAAAGGGWTTKGPYLTKSRCLEVQRTYSSSWTKIISACHFENWDPGDPFIDGYYFSYTTR